ncbi:MAG TPA: protein-L-isoaspartate(D-aspartate) O-methyltransferase [Thermoanaerobaculia bacterium]|jgi:protein-L-isoaspartate(D-aspartate) O-methyltransferase|nr:protein-L-isoaspartate(D-aspartate) O-methyltransferase [Thermoanaerobaculia bacterium]
MAVGRRAAFTALLLLAAVAIGMATAPGRDEFAPARRRMLEEIRANGGVTDPRVLAALEAVPRHRFVPEGERNAAYEDRPLPIGSGQTISQPSIVALMTSLLDIRPGSRILEVGTGSGYQAAVLSRLAGEVYSIEIVKPLGERARRTLSELGYRNVHLRIGDGYQGWPSAAPFDGIVVTAAPPSIPEPLLRQLKTGGKLVIPVGDTLQDLWVLTKRRDGGFDRRRVLPVLFVPMTGEAQKRPPSR